MGRVEVGSLPAELTSFVGRRREVGDVKGLLADGRLVTLTGVGGTGKTRLALCVATELRRAFPDGVWFVDLTQLRGSGQPAPEAQDLDALTYLVADALGLRVQSAGPPLRQLTGQLADRQTLLILDNCEHLIAACWTLADAVLRACPRVRILVTSRESLSIAGERIRVVPPLPVPDPQHRSNLPGLSRYARHRSSLTGLGRCAAVALFVARADAVRPGFRLTEQNHAAVADICRRLDGLPLAIELAAAHVRALAPEEILDRLNDRFALLGRGSRSAPRRQQTLRACVDWSFDLCSEPERRLWARVSVFAGGFQLDAVEDICADETLPGADLLDMVADLVDKSILIRDDQDGPARYRMLETIREYGREELGRCGEEAILRRRHADWCLRLAEAAERDWFGPDQGGRCRQLRAEHSNLRAAFDFYLAAPGGRQRAMRLAAAMWFYWLIFGLVLEGRTWLRRAAEANPEPTRELARALWAHGHLASVQGDLDAATGLLETAHDLARELGDEVTQARAIKRLGAVAMHRGDLDRANALLADALARFEALGEAGASTVHARIALAMTSYLAGDFAAAAEQDERILAICRARGDRYLLAYGLNNLARADFALGRLESAAAHAQEALRLRRSLPDAMTLIFSLDLLTEITAATGDFERAATFLGAAHHRWQSFRPSVRHWKVLAEPNEGWRTRTRQALGETAYAAAVRRGAEFTVDDVISYAQGQHVESAPGADAHRSDAPLTRREAQVAELIAQGMSNKQIAEKLVISQRTAESHVEHILQKLGLVSRIQVASWFHNR
ncbi:LuxR C-terminal-related transcriptional regulator [Actinoplanes sp. ATCC 53533]|uniref:LuxR C-terminal-related transcriptional regulator n=1 Tax=Actinoplanes sp. ATCC 53533 TaxID=1288362 RepID=UPI00131563F2|nr:LuxR C-terminal-related transcriptional regulator [Actinoplanes sp. ATCC 53533]